MKVAKIILLTILHLSILANILFGQQGEQYKISLNEAIYIPISDIPIEAVKNVALSTEPNATYIAAYKIVLETNNPASIFQLNSATFTLEYLAKDSPIKVKSIGFYIPEIQSWMTSLGNQDASIECNRCEKLKFTVIFPVLQKDIIYSLYHIFPSGITKELLMSKIPEGEEIVAEKEIIKETKEKEKTVPPPKLPEEWQNTPVQYDQTYYPHGFYVTLMGGFFSLSGDGYDGTHLIEGSGEQLFLPKVDNSFGLSTILGYSVDFLALEFCFETSSLNSSFLDIITNGDTSYTSFGLRFIRSIMPKSDFQLLIGISFGLAFLDFTDGSIGGYPVHTGDSSFDYMAIDAIFGVLIQISKGICINGEFDWGIYTMMSATGVTNEEITSFPEGDYMSMSKYKIGLRIYP